VLCAVIMREDYFSFPFSSGRFASLDKTAQALLTRRQNHVMVNLMKKALITALLMALVSTAGQLRAQYATPPPAPNGQMLDGGQLDQMLGPIALYPDPLIAEVLPAATQPSQIALAYNYVSSGGDQNAIDQQPWDGSVKALARYPDVLKMLGDNLPWTAQLGQAFLNQPSDVMDSVQRLRA
jgi:hypothetical protein